MKQAPKTTPSESKKANDYKINPDLQDKYNNQPLFEDKVNRANYILKTVGIPKFDFLIK